MRNGCTTEGIPNGRHWCSTQVNANLEHIVGKGNWGYCRASCLSQGTINHNQNHNQLLCQSLQMSPYSAHHTLFI